ncbi:hypothetical protein [Amycolatopsis rubida]|uniref:hypothetical protein n=1 Tax=Amycolatopsis rubida TaxID=112413 RepID=UPI001FCC327F|nr:hypothetical protein [Amycolatopsis rubida]
MIESAGARPALPRVCVIAVTSGSVSDAELGSAILEITAIVRAICSRCCRAMPPRTSRSCAETREFRCWAAEGRICGPASPKR